MTKPAEIAWSVADGKIVGGVVQFYGDTLILALTRDRARLIEQALQGYCSSGHRKCTSLDRSFDEQEVDAIRREILAQLRPQAREAS